MPKSMLWRMAFGVVLILGMGFATPGIAQGKSKAQNTASQSESATGKAGEREVRDGSIKVHGHWVIEVQNPDGAFVSRTEFENSLASPQVLTALLSRQQIPGLWRIHLGLNGPCPTDCFIYEPNQPDVQSVPKNLNVAYVNGTVVLTGSETILAQQTSFNSVFTEFQLCAYGSDPTRGQCGSFFVLTAAALNPVVNLTLGQMVTVTVTISFS